MIAVLVVVALIVYGSLYPWSFQANPYARADVLFRWFLPLTPRLVADAAANVLVYVPLGLALYFLLRKSTGRIAGWLGSVIFAFALSFALEYAQFFQPSRSPNSLDLTMNTIGGAVGASAAGLWVRVSSWVRKPSPAAALLWISWILALTFPLIPILSLHIVRAKLASFVEFDSTALLGFALQWLIAGTLLVHARPGWLGATFLLIPAQLLIGGRQPTLSMLAGASCGAALAVLPVKPRIAAAMALALLVLWQLAPFQLGPVQSFSWMPFVDAMEASRSAGVAVVLSKVFISAGCIALLVRGGLSFGASAAAVAALLGGTEMVQMWIPGRTPASTDPVIALLTAVALMRLRGRVAL